MFDPQHQPRGFWSAVEWPRGELFAILIASAAIGAFVGFRRSEPVYSPLAYGLFATLAVLCIGFGLWAFARVLKAWVNWPARYRVTRWLKAAIRFVFLGPKEPGEK